MPDQSIEPDPQPSDQFAADLGTFYRADVSVPRSLDRAILQQAHAHFARQRSRRLILRIGALATAAAAVIAIVVHLSQPAAPSRFAPVASSDVKPVEAVYI